MWDISEWECICASKCLFWSEKFIIGTVKRTGRQPILINKYGIITAPEYEELSHE